MLHVFDLDEKDKMILELLEKNPEMTQNDIARVVGLSQPSVGARIKRLKELGLISHVYGLNLKNSGLYVVKVDIKCRNPRKIVERFKMCPHFLNSFIVAGNKNLTLLFIGEDLSTVEAIIDRHLRPNSDVIDLDVGIVIKAERDMVMPIRILVEKKGSPCGSNCEECEYYISELCNGCPATKYYRGKLWK